MSGIARIDADRSAMFPHLMPLFTTVLGMVFLGEAPRRYHALGMV